MQRLFCPLLAATVLATALGGVATPASAAIRVTISDGVNPIKLFYSSGDAAAYITSIGAYDSLIGTASANFGTQMESGGSLLQSLIVNDAPTGTGTLPTLRVTADVIGVVGGVPDGEVSAGNQGLVLGQGLARFTLPGGNGLLVGSDIDSIATRNMGGTIQNNTVVNGTPVPSLSIPVGSNIEAQHFAPVGNPPIGYELSSQVVLTGAGVGSGLVIAAGSSVNTLTPEPGPLALWGLGALGIVATATRRRFARQVA